VLLLVVEPELEPGERGVVERALLERVHHPAIDVLAVRVDRARSGRDSIPRRGRSTRGPTTS
jgi:hypothetical protein